MIEWKALKSDLMANSYHYEFAVFEEFALKPSMNNDTMVADPEAPGGHTNNMRLGFALGELNKHMALAVQSIWEAAFRRFVRACANEVLGEDSDRDQRLRRANVAELGKTLRDIRGVDLDDLPGGPTLQQMVLVGNVVRHGDGVSCAKLRETAPDLWLGNVHEGMEGVDLHDVADDLCIRDSDVLRFADVVGTFWAEVAQTYHEQHSSKAAPWAHE